MTQEFYIITESGREFLNKKGNFIECITQGFVKRFENGLHKHLGWDFGDLMDDLLNKGYIRKIIITDEILEKIIKMQILI